MRCCWGVTTQAELVAIHASMASTPHWMLLSVMVIGAMLSSTEIVPMLILMVILGKETIATLKFAAR